MILLLGAPLLRADAQQGRISADTDVRSAPNGTVVAQLRAGTSWPTGATRNGFTSVTIEAWVDASRFGAGRDSFPVTIGGSANLRIREQPSLDGRILGSFRAGAGMSVVQRRDTWARVKREVWVPSSAIAVQAASRPSAAAPAASPAAPQSRPPSARPMPASETAVPVPPPEPVMAPPAAGSLRTDREVPLRLGPNGQVLAMLDSGVIVATQARERGWVRVRIEGWVPESYFVPADTAFGANLTAADLRADPEGHRGKIVRWRVQVVGLQTADPLRRDMRPDEPFLLAIGPTGEDATVYVTVPQSLVAEVRTIPTLSFVVLTARVRTGKSNPTGAPILELISIAER
ncbi:MAG: hypothetical protein C0506_15820 [Anaerolinea sp.]|nr:hypothetical protein [Anaerolinea sp.]